MRSGIFPLFCHSDRLITRLTQLTFFLRDHSYNYEHQENYISKSIYVCKSCKKEQKKSQKTPIYKMSDNPLHHNKYHNEKKYRLITIILSSLCDLCIESKDKA